MTEFKHSIPAITDSMGKYWDQPDRCNILTDATHALMSKQTFDKLLNYSTSIPSGVYDGKMWKALSRENIWLLRWYAPSENPNNCSINSLQILIQE